MRKMFSALLGFGSFFAGCSTVSVNQTPNMLTLQPAMEEIATGKDTLSVDIYLEKRLQEHPSEPMEWWTRFQQGKLWAQEDGQKSCGRFKALGNDPRFPLQHIAMLRALEVCGKDDMTLPPLEQVLTTTTEPWLQEIVSRTVLARAVRTGELGVEMKLSGDVASISGLQTEKVQLLKRALELATQLQHAENAAEYKSRLEKIAPRFIENPKPDQYITVALDFRKSRDFDQARAYYRRGFEHESTSDPDRYTALDGIRLAFKLEKKTDEYVAATRELAEFARRMHKKNRSNDFWMKKFHDSHTLLARTIWTERTVPEALEVIARLDKELNKGFPREEIRWLQARIEEEAGRFDSAVRILDRAALTVAPEREMSEKIQWYKAWNMRKLGRHKEAAEALKNLTAKYGTNTNRTRNRFWMAKSLAALGKLEAANKEYSDLIAADPLGYYGMLAHRELKLDLPPAQVSAREPSTVMTASTQSAPNPFTDPKEHAYVEWLLSVGEHQIARRFLDHFTASRAPDAGDSPVGRELLKYHARAGNFHALFARLGSFAPDIRSRILDDDPSLLFPQPYPLFVNEAGKKFGVAVELMYAIMRQESSFDPLARSHADAFGLMQLIPEAAQRVEGASGIKLGTPEDLYRPEINVTLGAAFLRNLLDQYNEQFILTVASYNASEKAIRGWMKTRYRGDALEFIEDIPYEETRGYVKLVMRNFIFYLRLNSGGRPVPFPEWCLDSLQDFNS